MKNLFKLSSLLFVGLVLMQVACSDDPPPPVDNTPDVVGKWALTSATLIDGNAGTATAEDLVITNFPGSPIAVNDVNTTTVLVGGALANTVCDLQPSYGSFFLETKADNTLVFNCPAEGTISTDPNTWVIVEDIAIPGSYNLTLSVVVGGTALPISILGVEVAADGSTLTGRAAGYPMVVNIAIPIASDNIQFIITDMIFTKVP